MIIKNRHIYYLLALIALCWAAWVVIALIKCKKDNVKVSEKLKELWSTPFWIGPEKLEDVRKRVTPYFAYFVIILLIVEKFFTFTTVPVTLPELITHYRFFLFILLAYSWLIAKHSLKQRLIYSFAEAFIISGIALDAQFKNSGRSLIVPLLFILMCSETDIHKIIKSLFVISAAGNVVLIFLSSFGVIPSGDILDSTKRGKESGLFDVSYSFGWGHPNLAGMMLAMLVVMWFIIRQNKVRWYDYVASITVVILVAEVIDSRGSLIFLIAFLLLFFILKRFTGLFEVKAIGWSAAFLPVAAGGVSIVSAYLFDPNKSMWKVLNKVLTGRIGWMNLSVKYYPVKLLGQAVGRSDVPHWDNFYIRSFCENGIIVFSLVLAVYVLLIRKLWNKKAASELAFVCAFLLYSLVESFFFEPIINISLMLLCSIILLEPWHKQGIFCPEEESTA